MSLMVLLLTARGHNGEGRALGEDLGDVRVVDELNLVAITGAESDVRTGQDESLSAEEFTSDVEWSETLEWRRYAHSEGLPKSMSEPGNKNVQGQARTWSETFTKRAIEKGPLRVALLALTMLMEIGLGSPSLNCQVMVFVAFWTLNRA